MERTNESAAALVERATGPFAPHLGIFVTSLIAQQYAASVIYIKALHALAFERWLAKRRVVLADLGEVHLERYRHRRRLRHQRIRAETRRIEWCDVTQLLQFLRDHGVCLTIWWPAISNIFRISKGWRPQRLSATRRLLVSFFTSVSAMARSICARCAPTT